MLPSLAALTLRTDTNTYIDNDPNYDNSDEDEEYDGDLALIKASFEGDITMVRLALNRGANVNGKRQGGKTALMMAAKNGHLNIVNLLLESGAEIDQGNYEGETALNYASGAGHLDVVELLLKEGAEIDRMSDFGSTALTQAVGGDHLAVVKLLLDRGANIDMTDDDERWTVLMVASMGTHVDVIELLLDRGAKIDEVDREGKTALMWATEEGHPAIVKLLLARGAKFGNELITKMHQRLSRQREALLANENDQILVDHIQRNVRWNEEILSLLEDAWGIRARYLFKKWAPTFLFELRGLLPPTTMNGNDGGMTFNNLKREYEDKEEELKTYKKQRTTDDAFMSFSAFLIARMRGSARHNLCATSAVGTR